MTSINLADVQRLAALSSLVLTEGEAASLRTDLAAIIGFVDKLNELSTDGVEPTYQVTGVTNVDAADEIGSLSATPDELLALIPGGDGSIKVPKVL